MTRGIKSRGSVAGIALGSLLVCGSLQAAGRTVELILDCSGSMTAKTAGGQSRIEAAKAAVGKVVGSLPADTQLAFRAYGHQSPREKHDCDDTQLLVPFAAVTVDRDTVIARAKPLRALGYTPITKVLELAAGDFPVGAAGERIIILVSDGKETCAGDPCATARALAARKIVIYTIGFSVDSAAKSQLQCIAEATGGTYFPAESADELAANLMRAATAVPKVATVPGTGPGNLQIRHADLSGHKVMNANGDVVGSINALNSTIRVPAGLYSVTFGNGMWKSVEVKEGQLTVLDPGVLEINNASLSGHKVLDTETRVVMGNVSATKASIAVMPGLYDITFGDILWPDVKVNGGVVTKLNPGVIEINNADIRGHAIRTSDGKLVGRVSATGASMPLPPGSYTAEIGGEQVPFTLAEGQTVTLDNGRQ